MTRDPRAGVAVLLGALDFGLVVLAGPRIEHTLQLGDAYPWLFSAGSFVFAASLPLAGSAVDRHGAGRVLRAGAAASALGLALFAVAPSAPLAFAARVVSGIGGAALLPAAWTLLNELDGGARRRGFAVSGGAIAVGFSIGAALGGPGAGLLGWRAACAAAAVPALALAFMPAGRSFRRETDSATGTRCLAVAAASIAVAVSIRSWSPGLALAALAAAAGAAWFVRGAAWLPSRWSGLQFCVLGMATTASGVGGTALLGRALVQRDETEAVLLVAFAAATPLALPLAARMILRFGSAACAVLGLLSQGAALAALATTYTHVPLLVVALASAGAGHVLANAGTAQLAMDGAGRPGPVAAVLGMAQYTGGAVGALVVFGAAGEVLDYGSGLRAAAILAIGGAGLGVMAGRRASAAASGRTPPRC